jgi:hypothetical protein
MRPVYACYLLGGRARSPDPRGGRHSVVGPAHFAAAKCARVEGTRATYARYILGGGAHSPAGNARVRVPHSPRSPHERSATGAFPTGECADLASRSGRRATSPGLTTPSGSTALTRHRRARHPLVAMAGAPSAPAGDYRNLKGVFQSVPVSARLSPPRTVSGAGKKSHRCLTAVSRSVDMRRRTHPHPRVTRPDRFLLPKP